MLISLETLHLKHSRQVFERGHDETRAGGHVPPASTCASICKITVPSLLSQSDILAGNTLFKRHHSSHLARKDAG